MNTEVEQFWDDFCRHYHLNGIVYREAFQFGVYPDGLARLVVEGKKTATTSGFVFYELEEEDIPKAGEFSIVLDSKEKPVAVIQTLSVDILPMNEVSEEFALAEGEGDYQYWWDVHKVFITEQLAEYHLEFSPDMLVVCERFKRTYP